MRVLFVYKMIVLGCLPTWRNIKMVTVNFFSFQKIHWRTHLFPLTLPINTFIMMELSTERKTLVSHLWAFVLYQLIILIHLFDAITSGKEVPRSFSPHLVLPSRAARTHHSRTFHSLSYPWMCVPILFLSNEGLASYPPLALDKSWLTHQDPFPMASFPWSSDEVPLCNRT